MTEQLRLNWLDGVKKEEEVKRKKAEKKLKKHAVSLEEAWERIFKSKLSDRDREKLIQVKEALEAGKIGREPGKEHKPITKAEALRLYKVLQETRRVEILEEMAVNKPDNYILIHTPEQFEKLLADLKNEPIISVDTETDGLDYLRNRIVGFNFTLPRADYHVYIPIDCPEEDKKNIGILPRDYVINGLKPILENPRIKKVLHNAKFDIHMMLSAGIRFDGLAWCTQVAMHVLNENEPSYRLKDLAEKYLKIPADNYDELFGENTPFNTVPLRYAVVYACKDTDLTWKLYQFQQKHYARLPELLEVMEIVELPIIDVSVEMERTGFVFDIETARQVGENLQRQMNEILPQIQQYTGNINLNSPEQLKKVLYGKLKLGKYLPKDAPQSTDKKILKKLKGKHPVIELILKYREIEKLRSTYVDNLPKQIAPDGRIHGQFKQDGTVTGRFSSQNPNLQNIPKDVRFVFNAPEGMVILSGDFSQQEPRILAHFTGEPALVEAYQQGKDLYSYTASDFYGVPYEECGDGSKYRKNMKTGILAVMYGTGAETLAEQLGATVEEAERFINEFYQRFPRVKAFVEKNKYDARTKGFVRMLMGRKRRLPEAKGNDYKKRAKALRQATNAIIQGSGAIQTKLTLIALHQWAKEKREQGRPFYLVGTVHDEIIMYAPADITLQEVREFENIMINTVKLRVPNKTDIEVQARWGIGVKYDSKKGLWVPAIVNKQNEKDVKVLGEYTDAMEAIRVLEKGLAENPGYKV